MRLDVPDRRALGGGDAGDGRDLIEDEVFRFPRRNVQLAAAEAGEIGKTRMCADRDTVRDGEPDGRAQHRGVATVEPGGDVCRRDRGHEPGVVTDRVRAEGFADVGVEIDPHEHAMDHEGHRGHKGKDSWPRSDCGSQLRTKQKDIALLRCPPAPPVWLPQQFTAPAVIRPATCNQRRQWAYPVNLPEMTAAGTFVERTALSPHLQICRGKVEAIARKRVAKLGQVGLARSRSDSSGSLMGHGIASAGSFHAMPNSSAGVVDVAALVLDFGRAPSARKSRGRSPTGM